MRNISITLSGALLALIALSTIQPAISNEILDRVIQNGKEAEARGDLIAASRQYYNIASSAGSRDYGEIPAECARLAGRRALALQLRLYREAHPSVSERTIAETYTVMKRLEPGNPSWPYLQAMWGLKTGNYNQCGERFREAKNLQLGPESVKAKIIRDEAKYMPQVNKVISAEIKDWDAHFDPVKWQQMLEAMSHYTPSPSTTSSNSSDEKKNDSWNGPSNNARAAGDYAAADRLLGGNGTSRDVGLYMH